MTHLRLVTDSPPPAPEPAPPQAYAPPPVTRGFPYPSAAFASHGARLAPSRLYPDRVPAPPGGRAHVTEVWSDLDFEQAVLVGLERLAAGRELVDDLGRPVDRYERSRWAGRRAAGYSGMQARIRPHLTGSHPWVEQAKELMERLAAEEGYWLSVEGRRR